MSASIDQPGAVRQGEQLDVAQLEPYLLAHLPSARGPLVVEQFPSGFSNLTYMLRLGDQELVLRRPPVGNVVKSAHDMSREYRVLSKLCRVYPAAPEPLLMCENEQILGCQFYVMKRLHGVILRKANTPQELIAAPGLVATLCESFIDSLAKLHRLDFQAAGLGELGRPTGYVHRQVTGWVGRYEKAKTSEYPEMESLGQWLADHQPADAPPALIHNDYKYDNLVLDPDDLTNIIGVLDWEMATIGDPLMDLGSTLAYWVEPDDPPAEHARAFGPTMLPGSLTRQQLTERYARSADIATPDMVFYYAFGLFKLAVIVQQIYTRYAAGKTQDKRFAQLNTMVESLGKTGLRVVETGKI
ncbi:MAG: phosphotransferase family protein [Planctomycetales bacterium]|nr:phosphotransferase family protein [Planctomycetales bacterium]